MDKKYLVLAIIIGGIGYYLYTNSDENKNKNNNNNNNTWAANIKKMSSEERRAALRRGKQLE